MPFYHLVCPTFTMPTMKVEEWRYYYPIKIAYIYNRAWLTFWFFFLTHCFFFLSITYSAKKRADQSLKNVSYTQNRCVNFLFAFFADRVGRRAFRFPWVSIPKIVSANGGARKLGGEVWKKQIGRYCGVATGGLGSGVWLPRVENLFFKPRESPLLRRVLIKPVGQRALID